MSSPEGPRPQRVRVTGPTRHRASAGPGAGRASDIDAETRLGDVYLGSLLRDQLRLALGVLLGLALAVGSLPLLFHLLPGLAGVQLLGLPVSWLLLGVVVYPTMLALGWAYVRRAERNERDFAEMVEGDR